MTRYFIDLDNTLCMTVGNNYEQSTPIKERVGYVNDLKQQGNHITIWTARGATSGIDHSELTKLQLKEWNVNYDELLLNKPNYDIYIDDKSFNVDTFWRIPKENDNKSKKLKTEIYTLEV